MLYVVATPIGNLGDMSPRAVETLRKADLIAAEDTRVTRKLLSHFGIGTPLVSCHEHNERTAGAALVKRMAEDGIHVALVTDAGTPALSDPGGMLVREATRCGIEVVAVPGPSALAAALSVSGITNGEFTFFGFLPRAAGELKTKLASMAGRVKTAVCYESPRRIVKLMETVAELFPSAEASVSCDLTKYYEKTLRGKAPDVLEALRANENTEKGEYCVVLDLSSAEAPRQGAPAGSSLEGRLFEGLVRGLSLREASERLRQEGESKNRVYRAALMVRRVLQTEARPGG